MTRRIAGLVLFLSAALFAGCVLGTEQSPGCRAGHPEDCGPGWVCRAGACLRYSTEAGPPGGDAAGDAPLEPASEPDAWSDAPLEASDASGG